MKITQVALKFLEENCAEYILCGSYIHFTYSFNEQGGKLDGWITPLGEFTFEVGFDFAQIDERGKDFISALPEFGLNLFVYQDNDDENVYKLSWEAGKQYVQSASAARGALKAIFDEAERGLHYLSFLSGIESVKSHPMTDREFVNLLNNCEGHA